MILCPTCQHVIDVRSPVGALAEAPLQPQERAIVAELARVYPRRVSMERLVYILWGDDADGGPERAEGIVRVRVSYLRTALKNYGWTIPSGHGGRGSHASYTLAPIGDGQ